ALPVSQCLPKSLHAVFDRLGFTYVDYDGLTVLLEHIGHVPRFAPACPLILGLWIKRLVAKPFQQHCIARYSLLDTYERNRRHFLTKLGAALCKFSFQHLALR